jgi:hypothetical protein
MPKPATTPKELGMMVAKAMLAGSTDMLKPCLPPYEAYAPILRAFAVQGAQEDALREHYRSELKKLREDVAGFPEEARSKLGFDVSEVRDTQVQAEAQRKRFADVRITLKTKDKTFTVRLDECLLYDGHWFLVDID